MVGAAQSECAACKRRAKINPSSMCRVHYREQRRYKMAERNKQIIALRVQGRTCSEIASQFDLSTERVVAICGALMSSPRPTIRLSDIIASAARCSSVSRAEIIGRTKPRLIVEVRHAVCLVAINAGHGVSAIGRALGRDHSTIYHAGQVSTYRAERDPSYKQLLDDILDGAIAGRAQAMAEIAQAVIEFDALPA